MIIKFNVNQKNILINIVLKDYQEILKQLNIIQITTKNKFVINIPDDLTNDIRDLCGEKLQEIGFGDKDDITQEGIILEELIDILYEDSLLSKWNI